QNEIGKFICKYSVYFYFLGTATKKQHTKPVISPDCMLLEKIERAVLPSCLPDKTALFRG
ncbi:hypothetical protein, partial [Ruminococcus callidus]